MISFNYFSTTTGTSSTGYVLGDKRIIDEAKVWIEAMFNSRQSDGWFGPAANKAGSRDTKNVPDLWPNMVALNALQTYYEYTGDTRVLELMQAYFKWELALPDDKFLPPFWQQQRASDNMASVYWLYNHTGQEYLLQLAAKIQRKMADWTETVASGAANCWLELRVTPRLRHVLWSVKGCVLAGETAEDLRFVRLSL